jgi:hypothetical protein
MTDLMIVETTDLARLYESSESIDRLLSDIRAKATSLVADVATTKGRKEIASMAFAISRTKTALDDAGKTLVAEQKKRLALVDAERKKVRDQLDALRNEVRRPLDDWEQAERDRVAALDARLADLSFLPSGSSAFADQRLTWIESVAIDDSWQERVADAAKAKDAAITAWKAYRIVTAEAERAQAEAAERARIEAERVQRERDERIAREAAERARIEAERRAEQARREQEARHQSELMAAERARIEAEKQALAAAQSVTALKAQQEKPATPLIDPETQIDPVGDLKQAVIAGKMLVEYALDEAYQRGKRAAV